MSLITREMSPREGGPAWLAEARARVASALAANGLPTKKTEAWRFTPSSPLLEAASTESGGEVATALTRLENLSPLGEARVVLVDGAPQALPTLSGVTLRSLGESLEDAALRDKLTLDDEDAFARVNALRFPSGLHVKISRDADPKAALEIAHLASRGEGSVVYPRVLVEVERGAEGVLVERLLGATSEGGSSHVVIDVHLAEGAVFTHVRLAEDIGLGTTLVRVHVARGAQYRSRVVSAAGQLARTRFEVSLEGEGADADLTGVYLAREREHIDHHLRISHLAPRCTSRMRYHGVVDGMATAVFDGITVVSREALGTEALQENRNLLLSPRATVHTKPHLEIDTDEVKCSHGTTVGSLDPQALFYLRARGIDEATARAMLTAAFVEAPLDAFPGEVVKAHARELVRKIAPAIPGLAELPAVLLEEEEKEEEA